MILMDKYTRELRTAIADYMYSEGCSCCENQQEHEKHEIRIAELLKIPKYKDGSGYTFDRYRTKGAK